MYVFIDGSKDTVSNSKLVSELINEQKSEPKRWFFISEVTLRDL